MLPAPGPPPNRAAGHLTSVASGISQLLSLIQCRHCGNRIEQPRTLLCGHSCCVGCMRFANVRGVTFGKGDQAAALCGAKGKHSKRHTRARSRRRAPRPRKSDCAATLLPERETLKTDVVVCSLSSIMASVAPTASPAELVPVMQRVVAELKCSICLGTFNDPSPLLCGHTFCSACLDGVACSDHLRCPLCKAGISSRPASASDGSGLQWPRAKIVAKVVDLLQGPLWAGWLAQHAIRLPAPRQLQAWLVVPLSPTTGLVRRTRSAHVNRMPRVRSDQSLVSAVVPRRRRARRRTTGHNRGVAEAEAVVAEPDSLTLNSAATADTAASAQSVGESEEQASLRATQSMPSLTKRRTRRSRRKSSKSKRMRKVTVSIVQQPHLGGVRSHAMVVESPIISSHRGMTTQHKLPLLDMPHTRMSPMQQASQLLQASSPSNLMQNLRAAGGDNERALTSLQHHSSRGSLPTVVEGTRRRLAPLASSC